jgi:selenocysteine lyase/cysteine desulfurase
MLSERRDFVKTMGFVLGASMLNINSNSIAESLSQTKAPTNEEDFWAWVQQSYTANPSIVNLNNGGVSPQPKVVQDAFMRYNSLCNEGPAYYMWQILDKGREPLREKLAKLSGCSAEEIAIDRNTTEALDTVIFGLTLKKGDEVVLTKYDYPNVINAWKQREMRDGVVIKWVDLKTPVEDDNEIVQAFEDQYNSNTRIVNITHMINWNGQLLPAKKIAQAAHKRGIEVIVDGAHTFAHLNYNIPDLECDYFGTSLHKWLSSPFGTGMLYVRKDKIKNLYPLFPNPEPKSEDIRKFEALGTRSFAAEQAVSEAINFHNSIGSQRKEERLRFLKNYWAEKAAMIDRVKFYTSFRPEYSCALFNFGIDGMEAGDISSALFEKYKIYTVAIKWEKINGVRVTPHVYTRLQDLDRFVEAIQTIAKK